ncbi:MAG: hypothetical protein LBV04_01975 [Deferribacteraceae bacterium]|jgi:hypothetical protein|nr:hypothetical protein [Deferribacteraceae bacterium]
MINDLTAISQIKNVQTQNPLGTQAQKEAGKPKAAQDSFELSAEAKRLMQAAKPEAGTAKPAESDGKPVNTATQDAMGKKPTQLLDKSQAQAQQKTLTAEEQLQLTRLQTRDTEVRAHEQAHVTAGGGLAGKPSYTEQQGPDGKMYAIGGQVPIDMSKAETPEKTLEKSRIIKAAALAPAQPSSEDRRIAAYAEQMGAEATIEIEKTRMQAQKLAQQQKQAASTANSPQQETNKTNKPEQASAVTTKAAPAAAQAVAAVAPKQTAAVAKPATPATKNATPAVPAPATATPKAAAPVAKQATTAPKQAVPVAPVPAKPAPVAAKQTAAVKQAAPKLQPGFSLKA